MNWAIWVGILGIAAAGIALGFAGGIAWMCEDLEELWETFGGER